MMGEVGEKLEALSLVLYNGGPDSLEFRRE